MAKPTLIAGVVVGVAAVVGVAWWVTRKPSVEDLATQFTGCLAKRDADCLTGFAYLVEHPELDGQKYREFMGLAVAGIRLKEPVQVQRVGNDISTPGDQVTFTISGSGDQMGNMPFSFTLGETDGKVICPRLADNLLLYSWSTNSETVRPDDSQEVVYQRALDGLRRDRSKLEALGIDRLASVRGPLRLDGIERGYVTALERMKRK